MNYAEDYREIFRGQVREIQAHYPLAHAALMNWGRWSRELFGIFPAIAKPAWTDLYSADPADPGWADDAEPQPIPENRPEGVLARPERDREPRSDEKSGIAMDARLHDAIFPPIWRRVIAAAYVTVEIPEDQFPREAKCGAEGYLTFLDGALAYLEDVLR